MSPFWSGFFEHLRSCGRNGAMFVAALAAFFGTVIITAIVERSGVSPDPAVIAFALLIALLICVVLVVRRIRTGRTRLKFQKLSDNELRTARERLKGRGVV